jgi:type IV pilus assembly protein PilV
MHMTPRRLPTAKSQQGFSMIEVLVSMVILLVGLLGLAGLVIASQKAEAESFQRSQAILLAQDMVSRITSNSRVAGCYAVTTDTTNGSPWLGTSAAAPPGCGLGTLAAYTAANGDLAAWGDLLLGKTETSGGAKVGGMTGARGCVWFDATAGQYMVAVAWQGRQLTSAPAATLACGKNQYGDERLRRVVSLPVLIPNLN